MSIGIVYFITAFVHAVVLYFSGRATDKGYAKKFVCIGMLLFGLTVIGRALTTDLSGAIIFQSIGAFTAALWVAPLDATFFKIAQKHTSTLILNRELYLTIGRVSSCSILILFMYFVPDPLVSMLILSGVLFLFSPLLSNKLLNCCK